MTYLKKLPIDTIKVDQSFVHDIPTDQDDIEIMASHGIVQCLNSKEDWFCGVTCTSGSGSPRPAGRAARRSREPMR